MTDCQRRRFSCTPARWSLAALAVLLATIVVACTGSEPDAAPQPDAVSRRAPSPVIGAGTLVASHSFTSISAGHLYNCGVTSDRSIVCWGSWSNSDGQASPPPGSFISVSAAQDYTCGVRSDRLDRMLGL